MKLKLSNIILLSVAIILTIFQLIVAYNQGCPGSGKAEGCFGPGKTILLGLPFRETIRETIVPPFISGLIVGLIVLASYYIIKRDIEKAVYIGLITMLLIYILGFLLQFYSVSSRIY